MGNRVCGALVAQHKPAFQKVAKGLGTLNGEAALGRGKEGGQVG